MMGAVPLAHSVTCWCVQKTKLSCGARGWWAMARNLSVKAESRTESSRRKGSFKVSDVHVQSWIALSSVAFDLSKRRTERETRRTKTGGSMTVNTSSCLSFSCLSSSVSRFFSRVARSFGEAAFFSLRISMTPSGKPTSSRSWQKSSVLSQAPSWDDDDGEDFSSGVVMVKYAKHTKKKGKIKNEVSPWALLSRPHFVILIEGLKVSGQEKKALRSSVEREDQKLTIKKEGSS